MLEDIIPFFVIACIFVVLPWLLLHYRDRSRRHAIELQKSSANTAELRSLAEQMEKRIEALEQILDTEAPGWRKKNEHA